MFLEIFLFVKYNEYRMLNHEKEEIEDIIADEDDVESNEEAIIADDEYSDGEDVEEEDENIDEGEDVEEEDEEEDEEDSDEEEDIEESEEDSDEEEDIEESEEEDIEEQGGGAARQMNKDPLYKALSHFFLTDKNKNLATILDEINDSLKQFLKQSKKIMYKNK